MSGINDRDAWTLITTALITLALMLWVGNGCWKVVVERLFKSSRKPRLPYDSSP
jgi:hypothetical protein